MNFNATTIATIMLVSVGAILSTPVLYQGFKRRGKGVKYEQDFIIQRAPQYASLATIAVIVQSFFSFNQIIREQLPVFSQSTLVPAPFQMAISWLGVAILASGLVFMIGGWYSLGECFTTDAEVLDKHTVRRTGLLKLVMHPAYSGIIQCLLGAAVASLSATAAALAIFVVAPLWLNRAKYEEKLMLETFGESYKDYARELKWRRLIPSFIPIGV
jgi:protein-S-isoprenylcysteine O-methyltransferase Ste14